MAAARAAGSAAARPPPRSMRVVGGSAAVTSARREASSAKASTDSTAEPMCAPMLAGSRPAASQGGQRLRQVRDRDAELGGRGAGGQVRMRLGVQCRVQAEADARVRVVRGQGEERGQLLQRLGVDQGAGTQGQVQLLVPLAHAVHHDPLGRDGGAARERQLHGGDHFGAGALGGEPAEELRVGVGLDRVGDQRAGEGVAVGVEIGGRGVQVSEIERRAPASDGFGRLVTEGRSQWGHAIGKMAPIGSPAAAGYATQRISRCRGRSRLPTPYPCCIG